MYSHDSELRFEEQDGQACTIYDNIPQGLSEKPSVWLSFFPGLFAALSLHTYTAVPYVAWTFYASCISALASAAILNSRRVERRRSIARIALVRGGEELRLLLNSGNEIQIGVKEIRVEDPGDKESFPTLDV